MPQSLSNVLIQIVYSTKQRKPWLQDEAVRQELYKYIAAILRNEVDSPALLINGVEDHIHMLCSLSRKHAIMDLVQISKTESSKWIKKQGAVYHDFSWQAGYGVFSVSQSMKDPMMRYIADQEEHHRRMSFQEEFREMCRRNGIEIDERFVWD